MVSRLKQMMLQDDPMAPNGGGSRLTILSSRSCMVFSALYYIYSWN